MKNEHRSRGKIISGIIILIFFLCISVILGDRQKDKAEVSSAGNDDTDMLYESVAESISLGNEKAADNVIPFGEVCHAENKKYGTYYGTTSWTEKLDIQVINVEVTKECREDFDFGYYGKDVIYSEREFGWNGVYVPYSDIADKDMNMISDYSYVLVTIEVAEKSNEDFELDTDSRRCALANFTLIHDEYTDPRGSGQESKAHIKDNRIDTMNGTVILESGEAYQFTQIYIIKDTCINENLMLKASPYGTRIYIMDLGIKGEQQ